MPPPPSRASAMDTVPGVLSTDRSSTFIGRPSPKSVSYTAYRASRRWTSADLEDGIREGDAHDLSGARYSRSNRFR
uniref:Uncharacterized protein n=1 Tax=Oryza glumipatula TaxID=40148 RepID=A0A0D9YQS5_9ORYZ